MYYEETDLSWRALSAGYRCRYAPASQALHDLAPGTPGDARLYYNPRNRMLLLLKHWHVGTLLLLSPALLVAEVLDWDWRWRMAGAGSAPKERATGGSARIWRSCAACASAPACSGRLPDAALLRLLAANVRPATGSIGALARGIVAIANLVFRANRHGRLMAAAWGSDGMPPTQNRKLSPEDTASRTLLQPDDRPGALHDFPVPGIGGSRHLVLVGGARVSLVRQGRPPFAAGRSATT